MIINQEAYSINDTVAVNIGTKAWCALLEEVYTTPKPGLVDLHSSGAHIDMDFHTFEKSAWTLKPYFIQMAYQGYNLNCSAEELFVQIRKTGVAAEQDMYRVTNSVNTHKGSIFTLGIFCAAAGHCIAKYGKITQESLQNTQQEMTVRILKQEMEQLKEKKAVSHGEKNYKNYGTTGIRGEAIKGYPTVWKYALPVLRQGIREHRDFNRVKLETLFVLMSRTEDSNILARQNPEVLLQVQRKAAELLKKGMVYAEDAWQKLLDLDVEYTRKNISPGGCADLLATSLFLELLLNE
ncbi:MAG: triphosphoribosyl-dephospho-CoA synthase CitG [Lachnospiraceae bacterium]|nr:triphosphoribosyl-dephospho-CoA synthase CitG [Lachnospiraceae bacterium]